MYAVSDRFLRALRYSHEMRVYVRVWRGGVDITPSQYAVTGLPIMPGGTVQINAGQLVRRSLSLTIATPDLLPTSIESLLAPSGTELRVFRGIKFYDTVEWVPLGCFRVDSAEQEYSGTSQAAGVVVTGTDRASYLADARFEVTEQSKAGTIVTEISRLITAAMPATIPTMVDLTGNTTACTLQTYDDKDRAGAIDRLAGSIGAELIMTADGVPTLRTIPALTDAAVWKVDSGSVGVLKQIKTAITRDQIFNSVVAIGEALDGTTPVQYVAHDTLVGSATLWGGPYGKKPVFINSPNWKTVAACQTAARTRLAQYSGTGWTLSLTAIVNPALTDGDVITVAYLDGRLQNHLIDTMTIPLDPAGDMPVTTRANSPGGDV